MQVLVPSLQSLRFPYLNPSTQMLALYQCILDRSISDVIFHFIETTSPPLPPFPMAPLCHRPVLAVTFAPITLRKREQVSPECLLTQAPHLHRSSIQIRSSNPPCYNNPPILLPGARLGPISKVTIKRNTTCMLQHKEMPRAWCGDSI
jgi:hypothetical protein